MGNTKSNQTPFGRISNYSLLTTNLIYDELMWERLVTKKQVREIFVQMILKKYSHRQFNLTDIIRFTIEGNLEMLMASVFSQKRRELVHIRGFYDNKHLQIKLEKIFKQQYCRHLWNPLLFAVEIGHLHIVRFFIEFLKGNVALLLQGPTNNETMLDMEQNYNFEHLRCFALILSIQSGHVAMFKYLLNHLHYLWGITDLKQVAKIISTRSSSDPLRTEFFKIFVQSRPFFSVFNQYFLKD